MAHGAVIALSPTSGAFVWTVSASWMHQTRSEVDIVAFALDQDQQVCCDEDFVFYGAVETPEGSIALSKDGPTEQAITLNLLAGPKA